LADKRKSRRGWIAGAITVGVGAAVTGAVAAERALIRRDRNRPDPYADEAYGTMHGTSIGPVASHDGTLLNVEEMGAGPTVVLVHGFSLNLTNWHHQMQEFAGEFRLVLYDQRGHGRSGRPPDGELTMEALAQDLDAVLRDAAGDEPVVVVGHSMGGMAALKFAEMFPEAMGTRVRGLVLVDTTSADVMGGLLPGFAHRLQAALMGLEDAAMRALAGRAEHMDRLRTRMSDMVYLGTRLMGFGSKPSPSQVAFVEQMLSEVPSDIWIGLIKAMLGLDVSEALQHIDVPTMVIVGERDKLTPTGAAERIAEGIAGSEFVLMHDVGHMAMLEDPESFNSHLRRFFARVHATTLP
jgi:pimeloyl-ACP methyl ester carboxylesterase